MSSTIVIYSSKYGTTKDYASWIAKELKADLKSIDEVEAEELIFYDTVIFGAPIYHGKLYHYHQMLHKMNLYPPHLFLIFIVGLDELGDKAIQRIKKQHHLEEDKVFRVPGQLNYERLTLFDKLFIQQLKARIKHHASLRNEESNFLTNFNQLAKQTNYQLMLPLIQSVKDNSLH